MVILRNIANQAGQDVGWDSKTGVVSIGGSSYTPNQLKNMGGQLVDNQWALPSYVANNMINSSPQSAQLAQQRQQGQLNDIYSSMSDMSSAYKAQQKASLASARDSQLAYLKKAYATAVSDGEISIRDADEAYASQAERINQQAYLDAEQTSLYSQDMGIQNSQQAVGLQQGDNARKNSLINTNMTTRDKRVADIRDRLTAIKTQKNLDMANVNAQYESGLAQAQATADQMYASNMFGLQSSNYSAERDQNYARQNMNYQNDLQLGQMSQQQQYALDNMSTQQKYALEQIVKSGEIDVQKMNVQHGLDIDTMAKQLANDLTKMNVSFGQSSALQSQSSANSIKQAQTEYALKAQAEENAYQKQLKRDLAGVTKGTPEYTIITKTAQNELQNNLNALRGETIYKYQVETALATPSTPSVKQPKDWTDGGKWTDPISKFVNYATGYDKNNAKYNAEVEAIKRRNATLGIED